MTELRCADARIERQICGIDIAATKALRRLCQSTWRQFATINVTVAISVHERVVRSCNVGAVIDQILSDTVPARCLHVARRIVVHATAAIGPAVQRVKLGSGFKQLMFRFDATVEALGVFDFAIHKNTASGVSEIERNPDLKGAILLVIGAKRPGNFARHVSHISSFIADLRRLRLEVDETSDLARPEIGCRRSTQNVNARRSAERRLIGAAVFNALETMKIGLGKKATHVQGTRHTIIRRRECTRRHGSQVVDRGHAISLHRVIADKRRRTRRLKQRLFHAEQEAARLLLQKPRLVAFGNNDHFSDLGRIRACCSRCICSCIRRCDTFRSSVDQRNIIGCRCLARQSPHRRCGRYKNNPERQACDGIQQT